MDADTLVKLLQNVALKADDHDGEIVEFSDETWSKVFSDKLLGDALAELDKLANSTLNDLKGIPNRRMADIENDRSLSHVHGVMENEIKDLYEKRAALDDLWLIHSGFGEVDALEDLGEFSSALDSLGAATGKLNAFKAKLPRALVGGDMLLKAEKSKESIQTRVYNLWEQAIVLESSADKTELQVSDVVEGTPLSNILQAIQEIEHAKITGSVEKLLLNIEQYMFEPILSLNVQQVEKSNNKLILIKGECGTVFEVLDILTQTIEFFNGAFKNTLLERIIRRFATSLKGKLRRSTFPKLFPASIGALDLFEKELDLAVQFETFLTDAGWSLSSHELTDWVNDFTSEWVDWRMSAYLERVRTSLDGIFLKLEEIPPELPAPADGSGVQSPAAHHDTADNWDWKDDDEEPVTSTEEDHHVDAGDDWAWDDDADDVPKPKVPSTVPGNHSAREKPAGQVVASHQHRPLAYSTAVPIMTDVIQEFCNEITQLGRPVTKPISLILTLYRALSPLAYQALPSPIVMYSDYNRLANWLLENSDSFAQEAQTLRDSSERILRDIILQRQHQISTQLRRTDLLAPITQHDEYRRAVDECLKEIESLVTECDDYVPLQVRLNIVGSVMTTLCSTMLASVQAIPDISEKDSERLASLIEHLSSAEKWFPVDGPQAESADPEATVNTSIAAYVASWIKLQYLHEILKSNLTDIQFLFDSGALVDFTPSELTSLIRALFADSEHARNAISHIHTHASRRG
jgi:centromere/kinetochore protein ZW10